MLRWNNDYCISAHPKVLQAIMDINDNSYPGYGTDEICNESKNIIRKIFNINNADIHYFACGTQCNFVIIKSAVRSYQHVICDTLGHINQHESGAVENTNVRIKAYSEIDGKVTPETIRKEGKFYKETQIPEFYTEPKLVYISFPNEIGVIYTKKELEEIKNACVDYNMYLYIDGARLGYGFGALENDLSPEDLANIADCFCIGGTKCGSMYGEAMVIVNDDLKPHFRNYMKQTGCILSKGYLIGAQFKALFTDNLYFDICKNATLKALKIRKAFINKGIKMYSNSCTNQQFVILDNTQYEKISKNHITDFEKRIDDNYVVVRFCTMWGTKDTDVDILLQDIQEL